MRTTVDKGRENDFSNQQVENVTRTVNIEPSVTRDSRMARESNVFTLLNVFDHKFSVLNANYFPLSLIYEQISLKYQISTKSSPLEQSEN